MATKQGQRVRECVELPDVMRLLDLMEFLQIALPRRCGGVARMPAPLLHGSSVNWAIAQFRCLFFTSPIETLFIKVSLIKNW